MKQLIEIEIYAEPRTTGITLEDEAKRIFEIANLLATLGEDFVILHKTARSLNDTARVDFTYDFILKELQKKLEETPENFKHLGLNLGYFGTKDKETMCGLSMSVHNTDLKFVNSISFSFPPNFVEIRHDEGTLNRIYEVFKQLVKIFGGVYFAAVYNLQNFNRYTQTPFVIGVPVERISFLLNDRPTVFHWMNFWGKRVLKNIDETRLKDLPIRNLEFTDEGVFTRLQIDPLNEEDEVVVRKQLLIQNLLGLKNATTPKEERYL